MDFETKDKPVFRIDSATIYCGNSIDIIYGLPESSVDVVFADPPYNLSNGGTTCHAGKRVSVNKGNWDESRGPEEDFKFHMAWIRACKHVLKPNGTIWISGTYHNIYACGYALQIQNWHILNDIIWYKPNAAPNLACRMFTASHETLLWARKDKNSKHYFAYEAMKCGKWENDIFKNEQKQMRSVWAIGPVTKSEKIHGKHPTQKPEALLERIIMASCPENGVVLDPFCGSGTTGIAAIKHNRNFIGIDISLDYIEALTVPRINDFQNGLILRKEMQQSAC